MGLLRPWAKVLELWSVLSVSSCMGRYGEGPGHCVSVHRCAGRLLGQQAQAGH
jgi:hypothetical protein